MRLAHLLVEIGDARHAARAMRLAAREHGHAAGIVAAIFEAPQSFDQNRDDVTLRNRADNAAHIEPFQMNLQGRIQRSLHVTLYSSNWAERLAMNLLHPIISNATCYSPRWTQRFLFLTTIHRGDLNRTMLT
ncbi:hypothetical protein R69919_03980 [Paraburkholderia gardini]|nr:hypothetical protein R69919_03980 [Paraburkholderia gardini]